MGPSEHEKLSQKTPSLPDRLPPLILGGAGFSYQQHPAPESLPVVKIVKRGFDLGMRCIDTSPYYEPSESLLGEALASPIIRSAYSREDYVLMTKVGRISVDKFDYSPEWIRFSVARSLQRLNTDYLDVVFVHDVEFMPLLTSLSAIATLVAISEEQPGVVRNIGISSYSLSTLAKLARVARDHLPRPLDVVQVWAHLNLQNSTLATDSQNGLVAFREAGVKCVFSSSPLATGLLRDDGVPIGALGDWHPAPPGLREACFLASRWIRTVSDERTGKNKDFASLALRYAVAKAWHLERELGQGKLALRTVVGVSSIEDLEANINAARMILKPLAGTERAGIASTDEVNEETEAQDAPVIQEVRGILSSWLDYEF